MLYINQHARYENVLSHIDAYKIVILMHAIFILHGNYPYNMWIH